MGNKNKSFKKFVRFLFSFLFVISAFVVFTPHAELQAGGVEMTAEEFIDSLAGQYFQSGEYEKALGEITKLLEKYPHDALLVRYQAIALDRVGRSEEAIAIFKGLISENPAHIPTRFFLAQAYARSGQRTLAVEQWKTIASHGEGTPYESWAQSALARTADLRKAGRTAVRDIRRWNVYGRYGFEYDSNVILRPDDESLRSARDQDAGRQVVDLALRYRAITKRDMILDLQYAVRQSFHADSFDEFNFHSQEFQANMRKRLKIGDQDVTLGVKYDLLVGFLEDNLFSVRNRWRVTADTRFSRKTRTVFHDQVTIANFGPDGFDRARTSRDGVYNSIGFTHYYFTDDFKKYVYLNAEFKSSHTRGDNFDTVGESTRVGLHVPFLEFFDFDASTGLEFKFYPNFSSLSSRDLSRRRNIDWDIYSSLTYHITPRLGLRGFYRYIHGDNRNNFFDYNRQIGGVHVIYSQSF